MGTPRIRDDGDTVTVDLHGLRVDEAVFWAVRILDEARRRGRSTARIIHGTSTSVLSHERRTIKQALYEWLESEDARAKVSGTFKHDAFFIMGLRSTGPPDRRPIAAIDINLRA